MRIKLKTDNGKMYTFQVNPQSPEGTINVALFYIFRDKATPYMYRKRVEQCPRHKKNI